MNVIFVSPPSSVGIVDVRPYNKNRKQKISLTISERENGKEDTFTIQFVCTTDIVAYLPFPSPKKTNLSIVRFLLHC
jgi:hypothetical protein